MASNSVNDTLKQAQIIASPAESSRPSENSNGGFRTWFSRGPKSEEQKLLLRLDIFIMQDNPFVELIVF